MFNGYLNNLWFKLTVINIKYFAEFLLRQNTWQTENIQNLRNAIIYHQMWFIRRNTWQT